jgi:hypothetical protein
MNFTGGKYTKKTKLDTQALTQRLYFNFTLRPQKRALNYP